MASASAAPVIQQLLELLAAVPALMFSPLELEALVPQSRLGKRLWQNPPGEHRVFLVGDGRIWKDKPASQKSPTNSHWHKQTHKGLPSSFGLCKSLPMSMRKFSAFAYVAHTPRKATCIDSFCGLMWTYLWWVAPCYCSQKMAMQKDYRKYHFHVCHGSFIDQNRKIPPKLPRSCKCHSKVLGLIHGSSIIIQ